MPLNMTNTEAVARRCSVKKVFLERACNFIKKETLALVFSCEFWEISKNTVSYSTPPVAASLNTKGENTVDRNTVHLNKTAGPS